jgi:hypothetical protein
MAEIQVERKPQRHTGWLVGLLLLVAVAAAGWYFTMGPGAGTVRLGDEPDLQAPPTSAPGPSAPASAPAPTPGAGEPAEDAQPGTETAPGPTRPPETTPGPGGP